MYLLHIQIIRCSNTSGIHIALSVPRQRPLTVVVGTQVCAWKGAGINLCWDPEYPSFQYYVFYLHLDLVVSINSFLASMIPPRACHSLRVLDPPCHNLPTVDTSKCNEFTTGIEQDTRR